MFTVSIRGVLRTVAAAKAFEDEVQVAYDEGLKNCATVLRNAARIQLRQPGSGRVYPSRVGATVRRQVRAIDARRQLLADPARDAHLLSKDRAALRRNRGRLRQTLARLKEQVGQPTRTHRASAPGEPPAPDVGLLAQAVKAGQIGDTRIVGVGGSWKGWEALHEGRGRVRGARPYFQLAIDRVRDRLPGVLVATIRARGVFDA